ncbi:hypothetical protein [Nocardia inohanensis]|uniref:hypothetical protein n=1 Tax=Nocardia inohanensis TaxID=209246 RepID=UPI000ADFF4BD|nr:hypothetical protein [Nocardia inohanensis]
MVKGYPVKHLLFLVITVLVTASVFDYARSAGHEAVVIVAGILVIITLIGKVVT